MKNKVYAVLLSLTLAFGIIGCGKQDGADAAVTVEGPKSEEDKMKKYEEPITLTFAKAEVVTNYPAGSDAQNNALYQMWEDVMGIKVENSILSASDAMTEKLQLAIASDEIPDFAVVDAMTLDSLIKNDMVTDMTDIYEAWATDNLKAVVGQQNNALFAPTISDGRYMAIPVANTLGDSYPILWVRSDWLENLGLSAPTTMDEVFEIAEKFTTEDPDGNGEQDTYGLYLDKDLNGLDAIMAAYEVYSKDEYWVKQDDGSYIAGCTNPEAKIPLEKLANLYEIGGIDHEFAVKDAAKEEELIAAGKIGIYIGYFYSPLMVMKDSVVNVGADWTAVPMPAAEGYGTYKPGVNLNVYGYIYAKKGISNPEAIVVMLNHLCDGFAVPDMDDGNNEFYDKFNELASDPEISAAGPNNLMPFQMQGNINWGEKFTEAIENGETYVDGKNADYQNVISTELSEEMSWAWKKVYLEGYKVMDMDNVRYSDYTGAPTDTMSKTMSLLNTQKLTDYISIIMGDQPVDYFDTFVETYNSIGGTKICEEIKAAME
ncbi:MAG: extracellular solute-binding protein [Lachnospiraceae bacterium]|nr:extracellular solute-binding protein [Lachnospiraceae bacterium]